MFQSPLLRGNGRDFPLHAGIVFPLSFSPLFFGATVATMKCGSGPRAIFEFQSPLLRGNGRDWWGKCEACDCPIFRFSPLFFGATVATAA